VTLFIIVYNVVYHSLTNTCSKPWDKLNIDATIHVWLCFLL